MALTTSLVVGTVAAGAYSANRASSAANRQAQSYDAATAEQARQFDLQYEMQQPGYQIGTAALNQLAALYGLGSYDVNTGTYTAGDGTGTVDYSSFYNSPNYQFALQQGTQAVQNSAAAAGGLYSGNALRAINDYAQGQASQQYNTYVNQLAGIAGVGQTAASNTASSSQNYANNITNILTNQANARASGITGSANAWTNTANQLAMLYGAGAFGGSNSLNSGWGSGANLNNAWANQWMGL